MIHEKHSVWKKQRIENKIEGKIFIDAEKCISGCTVSLCYGTIKKLHCRVIDLFWWMELKSLSAVKSIVVRPIHARSHHSNKQRSLTLRSWSYNWRCLKRCCSLYDECPQKMSPTTATRRCKSNLTRWVSMLSPLVSDWIYLIFHDFFST